VTAGNEHVLIAPVDSALDCGAAETRSLFGHPIGLSFLFLTGMWEVAALAGMRTVLVFYLINQLHFTSARAVEVYGVSTAGSFLMSMVGGLLADRLFGFRRAVVWGALLLAVGHFTLSVPVLLTPSLILIAVGSGLFRPALIGQVWLLYRPEDNRSNRALLLYKVGCQIGGIFGPLIVGALYEYCGWSWAVTFCGGGMFAAIIIYLSGRKFLPAERSGVATRASSTLQSERSFTGRKLALIALVGLGASLHWTVANQQGGTMAVWTFENLNRTLQFGQSSFKIPAAWFQTLNPIMILAFAPIVSWLWSKRDSKSAVNLEIQRMAFGSLLLAGSFAILWWGCAVSVRAPVSWLWLLVSTAPLTLGEIYIDSMGQAFFCRQAPLGYLSTFLSLWLVTSTVGYLAGGWLGELWMRIQPGQFFAISGMLALASAVVIAAAKFLIPQDVTPWARFASMAIDFGPRWKIRRKAARRDRS
jgi:proton-dependent oligopeptide transporter, POT family